jgi:hypothetical protein
MVSAHRAGKLIRRKAARAAGLRRRAPRLERYEGVDPVPNAAKLVELPRRKLREEPIALRAESAPARIIAGKAGKLRLHHQQRADIRVERRKLADTLSHPFDALHHAPATVSAARIFAEAERGGLSQRWAGKRRWSRELMLVPTRGFEPRTY